MAEAELIEFIYRAGLADRGYAPVWTPLSGGVSSDIWRVELPDGPVCVKRALPKLRVTSDWRAPIERNDYEWAWFNFVHGAFPGLVPRPIAHDAELKMLAMEFLDPVQHPVWKSDLLSGVADPQFAGRVGEALAAIHAASSANVTVPASFATDELFFALRIEPYLLATARKHTYLAPHIEAVAKRTQSTKEALVHGDVSPKNILIGPRGPVFLDAETAWFGDPAFDLAFCLNHLLLKSIWRPASTVSYLECFQRLSSAYLAGVIWEPVKDLEERAASLLPILLLARVDGKSPVEYLVTESQKNDVRERSAMMVREQSDSLSSITDKWQDRSAPPSA